MDILDIMMAKKLSGGGGGSDPVVENAKTTGGIGWTESEKRAIEWDGDTEGRVKFETDGKEYYKISSTVFAKADVLGGTFSMVVDSDAQSLNLTDAYVQEYNDGLSILGGIALSMFAGTYYDGEIVVPEDGTYFTSSMLGDSYTSVFMKLETPLLETIHKINEKYLPGGGSNSNCIINCTCSHVEPEEEDSEPYNEVTMSNDLQEIVEAIEQYKNIVVKLEDPEFALISTSRMVQCDKWVEAWYDDDDEPVNAVVYDVTAKFSYVGVYEEASVLQIRIFEHEGEYDLDILSLDQDMDFVYWRWDKGTFEDHIDQKIISAIGNAIGGEY